MSTTAAPPTKPQAYLYRTHIYRQLEPQHVELELPVRPFALVAMDHTGTPHWLDHTKNYRQEDLERIAAEGRLYLVHATRWSLHDEVMAHRALKG